MKKCRHTVPARAVDPDRDIAAAGHQFILEKLWGHVIVIPAILGDGYSALSGGEGPLLREVQLGGPAPGRLSEPDERLRHRSSDPHPLGVFDGAGVFQDAARGRAVGEELSPILLTGDCLPAGDGRGHPGQEPDRHSPALGCAAHPRPGL